MAELIERYADMVDKASRMLLDALVALETAYASAAPAAERAWLTRTARAWHTGYLDTRVLNRVQDVLHGHEDVDPVVPPPWVQREVAHMQAFTEMVHKASRFLEQMLDAVQEYVALAPRAQLPLFVEVAARCSTEYLDPRVTDRLGRLRRLASERIGAAPTTN